MSTARAGPALICLVAAITGCQSYSPRPLNLPAHREAFAARLPTAEGLAAFTARLARETDTPAAEFDPADGLSLSEGEAVALFFNPDLRLARLRAGAARASAQHAGEWDDPEFGLDAERILRSVDKPWIVGASIGLTIPVSGRLAVEKDRAAAAHRAELHRVAAAEWGTRIALRAAWLEWSAQTLREDLARSLAGQLEAVVSVATRLEQAGGLSRMEARLFRIEHATRGAALLRIRARTMELELDLRALMGLAPDAPVTLIPAPLAAALPPIIAPDTHPALAALRTDYEAAEEALRLEIRKQYPDLTLAPGLATDEGDSRVLLGLSLPIPLWNRNQRAIAEAAAQREIARAAAETEVERITGRLAAARAAHIAAAAQRAAIETRIVPLVEEQDQEARRVAELGQVDTLLMLENLGRLYDTKSALIDGRLAESLAVVRLCELAGPPPPPQGTEP